MGSDVMRVSHSRTVPSMLVVPTMRLLHTLSASTSRECALNEVAQRRESGSKKDTCPLLSPSAMYLPLCSHATAMTVLGESSSVAGTITPSHLPVNTQVTEAQIEPVREDDLYMHPRDAPCHLHCL